MKKLLILSVLLSVFGILSFAQPAQKSVGANSKSDSSAVVTSKKSSENQALPITGATKSVPEKSVTSTTEEEDFDEKELDELEASIAKAKAALGLKNVSTTTSSKSVPSRSKETDRKSVV